MKQTSKQASKQSNKHARKESKQASKETSKQASKQTSKQVSKETNKQQNDTYLLQLFAHFLAFSRGRYFEFFSQICLQFATGFCWLFVVLW